jgi:excisionase family DNA binding protein
MHFEFLPNGLPDKMLTVTDVADLLNVHPGTVRRWEREGQLRSHRFGPKGIIRFKREDIFKFISLATNCRQGVSMGVG